MVLCPLFLMDLAQKIASSKLCSCVSIQIKGHVYCSFLLQFMFVSIFLDFIIACY